MEEANERSAEHNGVKNTIRIFIKHDELRWNSQFWQHGKYHRPIFTDAKNNFTGSWLVLLHDKSEHSSTQFELKVETI